jgi:ElaB/YqjD/DUF883 family membrane-anchored ribosome-binding protein
MKDNTRVIDNIKDMIRLLENVLPDAEQLCHKGNKTAGIRIRKLMQRIKYDYVKRVRDEVQKVKTRENTKRKDI